MIYNFGTIWFYDTKANRQYDRTDNQSILHHFVTDSIPAFLFIVPDVTVTSATYILYDINDNEIDTGSCTYEATTNEQDTTYSKVKLTGATTSGEEDGKYWIKVTYNSTVVYSDVFCWKTDVSNYLKISAASAALALGGFPTDSFTYLAYFDSKHFSEDYEEFERGIELTTGEVPSFNSSNRVHSHQIIGYDKTLNFLKRLRTISTNGTVTITWDGEENEVYDIKAELSESPGNDIYIIDLSFKLKDYLQAYNVI